MKNIHRGIDVLVIKFQLVCILLVLKLILIQKSGLLGTQNFVRNVSLEFDEFRTRVHHLNISIKCL